MSPGTTEAELSIVASIAVTFWRHGTSNAGDGVIYESGGWLRAADLLRVVP